MHVELAPRQRESVTRSGSRRAANRVGGEVVPSHGGGIENMEIIVK